MARRELIVTTSDLSGEADADTVRFAFDGHDYEIDLTDAEVKEFAETIADYTGNARRVAAVTGRHRRPSRGRRDGDAQAIREWAVDNGIQVAARGRVSAELRAAYEEATGR